MMLTYVVDTRFSLHSLHQEEQTEIYSGRPFYQEEVNLAKTATSHYLFLPTSYKRKKGGVVDAMLINIVNPFVLNSKHIVFHQKIMADFEEELLDDIYLPSADFNIDISDDEVCNWQQWDKFHMRICK